RISILPTSQGEKIVIRLLTKTGKSFELEDLGFEDRDLNEMRKAFTKPYGMILTVGPTGSGKTTTLYSVLKILNSTEVNITTVEDPVEYELEGVNHVQTNEKAGLTFATGLRSILRQDPDIVMIGEIRDSETARIATNAALTGHLVLSTLHTNDAITTIPRLLDMEVERFLVATTINLVIAQRLARKLCDHCKKETGLDLKNSETLKLRSDMMALLKNGEKVYEAGGCNECNGSGYKGRIGLYETLVFTKTIRAMISEERSNDEIYEQARKEGLTLIVEDGIRKIRAGMIDIEELARVTALKE
ncbi:MAG: type II/IV secretion system protein, partial [Bdellovibrionales bacterium]|nr:type II/IV secretion system protein [Bdellovibrionales bacterium]